MGHVGLLAIGAYAFCLLAGGQGWNPFLALLAGGAICAVIGLLLGLPSLRLPGFYFAMATLAFGLIVSELALAEQWLTNGSVGMPAPKLPATVRYSRGLLLAGIGHRRPRDLDDCEPGAPHVGPGDGRVARQHGRGVVRRSADLPDQADRVRFQRVYRRHLRAATLCDLANLHHTRHPFIVNLGLFFSSLRSSSADAASGSSVRSSVRPSWQRYP